jgi:hypothetical protein
MGMDFSSGQAARFEWSIALPDRIRDFGLDQSKVMNVIDSNNLECAGNPAQRLTFPHPGLVYRTMIHYL